MIPTIQSWSRFLLSVAALPTTVVAQATAPEAQPRYTPAVIEALRLGGPLRIDVLVDSARLGGGELELAEITFPPGGPAAPHRHGATELLYVVQGELDHTVNGVTRRLSPGMVGIVRVGDTVTHRVASSEAVRALVVWTPSGEAGRLLRARGGGTPVPIASIAADLDAVRALREAWSSAYNAGDVDRLRGMYTRNAVRMPYDAPAQVGRDSVLAAYTRSFATRTFTPTIRLAAAQVEMRGDLAVERGSYDEMLTPKGDGRPLREVGKYVSLMRRGDDAKWRFEWSIFNRDARPGSVARDRPTSDSAMIDAARAVGAWLRSTHRTEGAGTIWPDDAMRPSAHSLALSDGVAGQTWFFSELYSVTGDGRELAAVREGAEMLMRELQRRDSLPFKGETTPYRGLPGAGIALRAAHRATNDPRYADAYRSVARDLAHRARESSGSVSWSDSIDVIFGDAGTGLFLLAAGRELRDTAMVNTAAEVARTILRQGISEHGGLTWRRVRTSRFMLPNFSHGAAGIGVLLAAAGEAATDPALHSGAVAASRYLTAVGRRDSLGFRVAYGWPAPDGGWARPFDVGWAHGSAGTARLFWQLWRTTGDSTYLALVADCVRAVRSAGLFGTPRPEYGRAPFALTMRFDLAGVADFLADLYSVTGDRAHLQLAREIADTIIARAERPAAGQLRWVAPRYGFMTDPGQPGALTGYLHGATGYGILFLKLHALERGLAPPYRLPDNPFGR